MSIGTKSVLFGAHQFILHPIFLFVAWWELYGFPWDPRLWVAFIVHDLGYWGKPNMDGPEGELHPYLGAKIMGYLFDVPLTGGYWYNFTLYHSRYLAKAHGVQYSRLSVADKFVPCLMPWWLYLPCVRLTGEIDEYLANAMTPKLRQLAGDFGSPIYYAQLFAGAASRRPRVWFSGLQGYMAAWVAQHKDGAPDTWTTARHKEDACAR